MDPVSGAFRAPLTAAGNHPPNHRLKIPEELHGTNNRGMVKKFMLSHYGFERPTPETMEAWQEWFQSIAH
jgi:hypothetical protein